MPRTLAAEYDSRRQAIITAATVTFAKHGFRGTTLGQVATLCHMSKASLFHYFPSKEDMLFAIMEAQLARLQEAARLGLQYIRSSPDTLRWFGRLMLEQAMLEPGAHKILLTERDNLPPDQRAIVIHVERELLQALEKILIKQCYSLENQPKKRRPLALSFFAMLNGINTWFKPDGPTEISKIADMLADVFAGGLRELEFGRRK